jgi:sugar phosphate isomerase/epimerase
MKTLLQLYSARNFQPWQTVLETTAAVGYDGVEPFAAVFGDAKAFRLLADRSGLSLPSAHVPLQVLEEDPEEGAFAVSRALGTELIVIPYLSAEERPTTRTAADALAARLAAARIRAEEAGFGFAYHNHDFEFVRLEDGSQLMDVLLTADPGLNWEADIGWLIRAGEAPLIWLERYAERIVAVHLKDYVGGESEGGWADLGHGPTDYAPIFAKLATLPKLRYCVAEHDDPSDFGRFARRWMESYVRLAQAAGVRV